MWALPRSREARTAPQAPEHPTSPYELPQRERDATDHAIKLVDLPQPHRPARQAATDDYAARSGSSLAYELTRVEPERPDRASVQVDGDEPGRSAHLNHGRQGVGDDTLRFEIHRERRGTQTALPASKGA
jgi:hypothetical protein